MVTALTSAPLSADPGQPRLPLGRGRKEPVAPPAQRPRAGRLPRPSRTGSLPGPPGRPRRRAERLRAGGTGRRDPLVAAANGNALAAAPAQAALALVRKIQANRNASRNTSAA